MPVENQYFLTYILAIIEVFKTKEGIVFTLPTGRLFETFSDKKYVADYVNVRQNQMLTTKHLPLTIQMLLTMRVLLTSQMLLLNSREP